MAHRCIAVAMLLITATACGSPSAPAPTTGLTGTVLRGPITPVCTPTAPCDAPFSATFTVERNASRIGQFQSDAQGQFSIMLSPGRYRVVPASDAPIIAPTSQFKDVDVGDVGLTHVELHFDTGIR
jgi:hypothetical protein